MMMVMISSSCVGEASRPAARTHQVCATRSARDFPHAPLLRMWLTSLPAVAALMGGRRDIVVITHGSVGAASEVRALAQCATAALHLRHGMRESARVWLTL